MLAQDSTVRRTPQQPERLIFGPYSGIRSHELV